MKGSIGCGALVILLVACTATPQRATKPGPTAVTVEDLAAAIAADSQRSDHESDSKIRGELASEASRAAEACLAREPQAAACLYGHAVALGLEARAHPTRAGSLLNSMLEALASTEAVDPNYDEAGPSRVRALVLIRAPGWPLGPGDADAGLVAARRAVTLRPRYPPNLLALAESLEKTGDAHGALEAYARARDAAHALPATADRDGWLREAERAMQRK